MEEVYHLLITLQDDLQSQQMAAYMRDQFAFLGIRTPVRRQAAKSALTEAKKSGRIDWSFVDLCWASGFREHHYLAIDYLLTMSAHLKKADLPKIEQLLLVDPWWDTVDALSGVVATVSNYSSTPVERADRYRPVAAYFVEQLGDQRIFYQ